MLRSVAGKVVADIPKKLVVFVFEDSKRMKKISP